MGPTGAAMRPPPRPRQSSRFHNLACKSGRRPACRSKGAAWLEIPASTYRLPLETNPRARLRGTAPDGRSDPADRTFRRGFIRLSVVTAEGISKPVASRVDGFAELLVGDSTPEHPTTLRGPFRTTFRRRSKPGLFQRKAGGTPCCRGRAKRIGSGMDPVSSSRIPAAGASRSNGGRPICAATRGSKRICERWDVLSSNCNDLEYRAPADSQFRLLVATFEPSTSIFRQWPSGGANERRAGRHGLPFGTLIAAKPERQPAGLTKFLTVPPELHGVRARCPRCELAMASRCRGRSAWQTVSRRSTAPFVDTASCVRRRQWAAF